jgi:transposase InsO family protein
MIFAAIKCRMSSTGSTPCASAQSSSASTASPGGRPPDLAASFPRTSSNDLGERLTEGGDVILSAARTDPVPTATFRVLYGWFAIGHERRDILHFGVTDHPTAAWVIQQLRETFPFTTSVRRLVFDRDTSFSAQVVATVKSFELKPKRISFRSPWQNGVAERWIQTLRRELLDHVVVFNEEHLRALLGEFVTYYHQDRTHLGLAKDAPTTRAVERPPAHDAVVVSLPRVGGLHHRYTWRAPEGAWT